MGRAIRHRPGASPAGRTTPAQHPPRSSPRPPPRPTDPAAGSPILDALAKAGVAFVALKENIRVEGKSNIQTKVMTTLFALFAEVERDLISERTREALPGPGPRAGGSAARKGSLCVFTARRQGGPSTLAPVPWSLELRNSRDRRNNSRISRRSLRVRLMNSRRRFEDFGQCVTLPSRWDGRRGRREQPTPPAPSTADTTSTGAIRRAGHDRTARAVVRQSPRYTSAGSARASGRPGPRGPGRGARGRARFEGPISVLREREPPGMGRLMPPRWREEGAGGGACKVQFKPRRPCGTPTPQPAQPNGYQDRVGAAAVAAAVGAPRAAQPRSARPWARRSRPSACGGPITPFMGPSKEGTRILAFCKTFY